MESEGASNPRESNDALEITSENNVDGDDKRFDDISKSGDKRKHTSEVWTHFKRVNIDSIQFAECNYCKTHLKAPPSHGTSHLKKHYDKTCKKRPKKMDIRQSFMIASKKSIGNQDLTTHIFSQEDSRHKLAVMVILHDYALGIVDHEGFQDFVSSLQPCFKMISRNTLKNDILKIYDEEKSKCYKLLGKLKCRIAITTDMWTSNNTKKGFMAVTGHFIDDSWTLQSVILRYI